MIDILYVFTHLYYKPNSYHIFNSGSGQANERKRSVKQREMNSYATRGEDGFRSADYLESLHNIWLQYSLEFMKVVKQGDVARMEFMLKPDRIKGAVNGIFQEIVSDDMGIPTFLLFANHPYFRIKDPDNIQAAMEEECIQYFLFLVNCCSVISQEVPDILLKSSVESLRIFLLLLDSGLFNDQLDDKVYNNVVNSFSHDPLYITFVFHPSVSHLVQEHQRRSFLDELD